MKKIYLLLSLIAVILGSCNEDKFLKETPLDFLSGSNAYTTASGFDLAVNELYYLHRWEFYTNGSFADYLAGGDELLGAGSGATQPGLSNIYGSTYGISSTHWDNLYKLIGQANTVISRLKTSPLSSSAQALYKAKGKFFRSIAYSTLDFSFGDQKLKLGVPLQMEEVTTPKTDYTRASYIAVLDSAISDMEYAAANLPLITAVKNGEISAPAANHYLSELYLARGAYYGTATNPDFNATAATAAYQKAVDAATAVIGNSAFALMTSRFGTRKSETPGDVYWDLYRKNNQNRSAGNTEGIWVIQFENLGTAAGGEDITSIWGLNYQLERNCAPQTGLFRMSKTVGTTISQYVPFNWPTGDYTGGRGIGSYIADYHFDKEVWGGYGSKEFKQDIRNANHNMVRKFRFNPSNASQLTAWIADFGNDTIDIDKYDTYKAKGWTFVSGDNNVVSTFPARYLTCYQTKCTSLYQDYPSALLNTSTTSIPWDLTGSAGGTYNDQYNYRLAETYLLRAEAYVRLGNFSSALADINIVRNRANAVPATMEEVSATGPSKVAGLDYVLDERMRELGIEEKRRLTLAREGEDIFYYRVVAYNPYYAGTYGDANRVVTTPFSVNFTRWSIPQTAIDGNKDAVLIQNTGF